MFNHYKKVLKKVPIWKIWFLLLGMVFLNGHQLIAQGFSSSNDIIEIEDIYIEPLSAQAGRCYQESAYYITQDYKNLYFKAAVPLTGNLNLVVSSDVEISFCALEETSPDTLTVIPGKIQDNRTYLDTFKLTGLTPCDTIYYEIKSYDFRQGQEVKVCLYEPILEVTCGVGTTFTDSNVRTGSGSSILTNYKPNEHTTTVICPDDPDKRFISLFFDEFWVQKADSITGKCLDFMQILDGDSPSAPPIEINGKTKFCGNDLFNELIYATDWPSGCLTVVFHSNSDTITGNGWEAKVDCEACNINFKAKVTESCIGGNRRIDITATGGSGVYEYRLNSGPFQDIGTFYTSDGAFSPTVDITVKDKNDSSCSRTSQIADDSQALEISIHDIQPTNCDGKDGSITVKVTGGVEPYKFDLQGDNLTGGYIEPIRLNDSLFLFKGQTLTQFDPVTGIPYSKLFEVEITDGNYCIKDVQDQLESSCNKTLCGMDNAPVTSDEKIAYYCAEDETKKIIIDTFSIGDPTNWLISDSAIVNIVEGQGRSGKLIASYSRKYPPEIGDFPLFTKSSCVTVFVTNDNAKPFDNEHTIETSCANCDYTVDVEEYNADCEDAYGKAAIKIWGNSQYSVTLLESFPLQTWTDISGNQTLTVGGLIEGRYTFKVVEKWFKCEQYVTVDIGRNNGPEILSVEVTNETCDKQGTPNGTALVTVTGGSGNYLYSTQGDAPGSDFFPTPVDGSTADMDERKDTVAFLITGLEGNGFLTQTFSYTLVVKDAYLTSSECKDTSIVKVGDNCFNKKCEGTFYDAYEDRHVMPTDDPLSKANYNDTIPFVSVICPNIHDRFVTVAFDTFNIAKGDTLFVYDSTAVGSEAVLIDHYVEFGLNKKSVTATNPTGCLTFSFKPNRDDVTAIGWFAQIECNKACDLSLSNLNIRKETCEEAKDGSVQFNVNGGSGKRKYSLRPLGEPLKEDAFQTDSKFRDLVEGKYVYVIRDTILPNCELTDTIEVDRHPPITWIIKSPGLTCGARTSTITIIPKGGSGTYKILPAGIEADAAIINEGQEFSYDLVGAVSSQFKINDAANPIKCYDIFTVKVNDNCRFTCYEDSQFSSNRPFDGSNLPAVDSAGYANYEHTEITYCSHYSNQSIKAEFQFFETEEDLDVLSIYNGKGTTGQLIGEFSGKDNPGTIISTSPNGCLTFAFETNRVNNDFIGFLADLTCVSCKLSASYKEVSGETFCWDKVNGDENGFVKVVVDYPLPTDTFQFQLRDAAGTPLSDWKDDNNNDAPFADLDNQEDLTKEGIRNLYVFGKLKAGEYKVAVRNKEDTTCLVALQPAIIEKIDTLAVTYTVTNANCEGEFGSVCITPISGSGKYSYSTSNSSMSSNTACFPASNQQTLEIEVTDDITGCTATVVAYVGSDCKETCTDIFTDDAGSNGIPDDGDEGTVLYAKNLDTTWIFCPTIEDKFIEIDFTDFETSIEDTLTIIDGDGYGNIIGQFSGTNSPGIVRSSTRCLTVKFKSNGFIEKKGWIANVSCFYCPSDLKVSHNVTNTCGYSGAVQVTATATGYTDFLYSLDGENWNNTTGYFASVPSDTKKVYAKVKDYDNCITSADLIVNSSLVLNYEVVKSACTSNTGSIELKGSGGSGLYTYQLGTSSANLSTIVGTKVNGLAPGTYKAKIIDNATPGCSKEITIIVGKENCTNPPTTTCVSIETYLFLAGPYDTGSGVMKTTLNDLGYLPGQQPSTFFGTPTPAGQPYNVGSWNYNGTEGSGYNYTSIGNAKAGYNKDVVDWVLLSLRSSTAKTSTVCRYAALLYKDGRVVVADNNYDCCKIDPTKKYYVVVEHRNHLLAMSHEPVSVLNSNVKYDFRVRDSYKGFFGVGQKRLSSGVYALFSGNGDQDTNNSASTDINVVDKNKWVRNNGANSSYYFSDFDMNGDVNGFDKGVWLENNGKASDVPNN